MTRPPAFSSPKPGPEKAHTTAPTTKPQPSLLHTRGHPPFFLRPHRHTPFPPSRMPNLAPLPRPSRCSSPDPALTRPTWLNSYPPPATVNPCRARPENGTQPAAFIHPRGQTPGQQEAAPAAFWFAAGASVWTEGQNPASPCPFPDAAASPDRPPITPRPLSPTPAAPPSAVARLNLRRVGQKSGKGLRPTTLLCLPHRLASELEAAHRSLVGACGPGAFPPASPPAPGPLPAGLQTGCVVR